MKKAFFAFLLAGIFFIFGCSEDKGSGNSTGLPAVPNASCGKITESDYLSMPNKVIEDEYDLQDFLYAFASAMGEGNDYYWTSEEKATRTTEAKKKFFKKRKATRATYSESDSDFEEHKGLYGRMTYDWSAKYTETESQTSEEYTETGTQITCAFDFSEDGNLFIGGGVGMAYYAREYENVNGWGEEYETKVNGTFQFRGEFTGSFSFRNIYMKETYKYDYRTDKETEDEKISGQIVITSGGKEFKFDAEDLEYLLWGMF
ncbi:MAG: hypothetical protein FWF51_09645 [Chitinivibrionia bacterium]|nr:hypothetical protein [Chitinivibrionia bacterium]